MTWGIRCFRHRSAVLTAVTLVKEFTVCGALVSKHSGEVACSRRSGALCTILKSEGPEGPQCLGGRREAGSGPLFRPLPMLPSPQLRRKGGSVCTVRVLESWPASSLPAGLWLVLSALGDSATSPPNPADWLHAPLLCSRDTMVCSLSGAHSLPDTLLSTSFHYLCQSLVTTVLGNNYLCYGRGSK